MTTEMIERLDMVFVGNINPNYDQDLAKAEIYAWAPPGKVKSVIYSQKKTFAHVTFATSIERKKFLDKKMWVKFFSQWEILRHDDDWLNLTDLEIWS